MMELAQNKRGVGWLVTCHCAWMRCESEQERMRRDMVDCVGCTAGQRVRGIRTRVYYDMITLTGVSV
jgi:hypothetical protein